MSRNTVLLVDDDTNLLAGLRRALRKEPYDLLCAASAEEALGILRSRPVDVVVSDHDMPGMNGTVFLTAVRHSFPDTVRFILTGKATLDMAIAAINDGAVNRFFTKPCNHVDLAVTIRDALQRKRLTAAARKLAAQLAEKTAVIEQLEKEEPGITRVARDESGAIVLEIPEDPEELIRYVEERMDRTGSPDGCR